MLGCLLALHKVPLNPSAAIAEAADFWHGHRKSVRLTFHAQLHTTDTTPYHVERNRDHLTATYTSGRGVAVRMSPTVDDLRNEIRQSVDRYERVESTAFTKEALAAVCDAVGYEIDENNFPSKPQMRAGILWKIGERDDDDPADTGNAFRKAELEAIAAALRDS